MTQQDVEKNPAIAQAIQDHADDVPLAALQPEVASLTPILSHRTRLVIPGANRRLQENSVVTEAADVRLEDTSA